MLERDEVSELVLDVLRGLHFDREVNEESQFGVDILLDEKARRLYYYALRIHLEKLGYVFCNFSVEDCEKAESVKDIVDAVWRDLGPNDKGVM